MALFSERAAAVPKHASKRGQHVPLADAAAHHRRNDSGQELSDRAIEIHGRGVERAEMVELVHALSLSK